MPTTEQPGMPCHLAGLSVLVTRPREQADSLCDLIAAAHGRPIRFPTLEILGPSDKHAARSALAAARTARLLVFVSSNAVQYAFPLLPDELPVNLEIAAVGQSTAKALEAMGLPATLVPERMDSEGLLALPALEDMHGRSTIILRGNGGRELIAQTLRERGADVLQVEVYRRQLPARSGAILDNLFILIGDEGAPLLRRTPLIVVSQRLADHALTLGCEAVHVAASAQDQDVLVALCAVSGDVA